MRDIAIKVENLSKVYKLYDNPVDRLKESLHPFRKKYHKDFFALEDANFEVKKGETLGIIGKNGSGKSTLLKLITGVLTPSAGNIKVIGKVSALLELGAGFNPELTGIENVYFNSTLMGYTKEETDSKIDKILSFADIGEFAYQPVKSYSSGMFVRLAFAVAINVDPEILIIDEALAVGDMNFQAKCMTALTRFQENGATVIFVSHDTGSIKSLCSRAMHLEHGKIINIGSAAEVAEQYIRTMREELNEEHKKFIRVSATFPAVTYGNPVQMESSSETEFKTSLEFTKRVAQFRYGTGEAKIVFVELLNLDDEPINSVEFNEKVKIRIYSEVYAEKTISVNLYVLDDKKVNLVGCGFRHVNQPFLEVKPGEKYLVEYTFRLPLQAGNYSLQVHISSPIVPNRAAEFIDAIDNAVVFSVNQWEKARLWSKVHLFPEFHIQCFEKIQTGFRVETK